MKVARLASLAVGVLAVLLGLLAQGLNVAVLLILAISIAASANSPLIVLSLFWRRFNTSVISWGIAAGVAFFCHLGLALAGRTGSGGTLPDRQPGHHEHADWFHRRAAGNLAGTAQAT